MADLVSPTARGSMKPGVNYFPDLPDTFETVTGYVACGADMVFTPYQLNAVRRRPKTVESGFELYGFDCLRDSCLRGHRLAGLPPAR
jgi:hypothetical protein